MTQFKVGDKVFRMIGNHNNMTYTDTDVVTNCYHLHGDTIIDLKNFGPGHDASKFVIVEDEKPMKKEFDLKNEKWFIRTPTPEISKAVQLWLFDQGIGWYVKGNKVLHTDKDAIGSGHVGGPWLGYAWANYWISKGHKEIKITFKTVIDSVEYPIEPEETQAQKDFQVLSNQITKLSEQAAKLKESMK